MFSTEQASQRLPLPLAATVAVRWQHWWKTLGLEWKYRAKVFNYNTAANDVSPQSLEARVYARYTQGLWWDNFLREVQVSPFFGTESYQNTKKSILYNNGYSLLKAGLHLNFPLWARWSTGGEIVSGQASDGSKKTELAGQVSYFMKKNWTFGMGYRAHAFEAGSAQSAPAGLPYREAYAEGYTTLQYFY
jgi:hypothetical protein